MIPFMKQIQQMESLTKHCLIDLKTYEQYNERKRVRRKLFVTERKDKVVMRKDYIDDLALINKLDSIITI